jgi:hypothetical protein
MYLVLVVQPVRTRSCENAHLHKKTNRRNKPSPKIEHVSPWRPKTTADKYHNERSQAKTSAKKNEKENRLNESPQQSSMHPITVRISHRTTKQSQQTANEHQNQNPKPNPKTQWL